MVPLVLWFQVPRQVNNNLCRGSFSALHYVLRLFSGLLFCDVSLTNPFFFHLCLVDLFFVAIFFAKLPVVVPSHFAVLCSLDLCFSVLCFDGLYLADSFC